MCLAQGHNAATPVRLEPAAPQSPVKHYTTEPLRSPVVFGIELTYWSINRIKVCCFGHVLLDYFLFNIDSALGPICAVLAQSWDGLDNV